MRDAVDIFKWKHPDAVAIFVLDCLTNHEAQAPDALNVNNMNVNPGGKQTHLRDTIILLSNPPPQPGQPDTRGMPQMMVYPESHPDPALAGKAKGMKAVLKEHISVREVLCSKVAGGEAKVVGKCKFCKMSEQQKDAQRPVAQAEEAGQEETLAESNITQAEQPDIEPQSDWCCMHRVLSLQDNFANETPMIQKYVESRGHVCLFYPKFHCELNPMEMVWGFVKYCELLTSLYSSLFCLQALRLSCRFRW